MMEDSRERLVTCISDAELERRWKAAREMMKGNGLDFLLMRNDEEYFGGYVKWFTDIPARHSYPFTVIFPVDDEMTTITSSPPAPADPYPKEWAVRGVKRRLGAPYYPSLSYTSTYDAELAVQTLKGKKRATIGLVGRATLHLGFYEYLVKELPGFRFVDATDQIDRFKAIKSPEEMALIKGTAKIQDEALAQVEKMIKPGVRDVDIYAEAHHAMSVRGSERCQVLISSYTPGQPVGFQQRHFMNRMIKERDCVTVLIEGNGPGGYYTEIARTFVLGKPSQEMEEVFGNILEAQQRTLDMLKPGMDPKEIWNAHNALMDEMGYPRAGRMYAHGEGYELVERPAIRYDEPMKIQARMNITAHPTGKTKNVWLNVCDNYLVTETGVSACLHKTPKELIVVQ
jgi:Xaa-Pro aminopeptidase